jgi:hypothetical protein
MNANWIKFDEISMFQMKLSLKFEYVGIILDMFWSFILFVPPHHSGAFLLLSFRLIKCQVGNLFLDPVQNGSSSPNPSRTRVGN